MIKGKAIYLFSNGAIVAMCTGCSLRQTASLIETASKSGRWAEYAVKSTGWEVSSNHLVSFGSLNIQPGDIVPLAIGESMDGQLSPVGMRYAGTAIYDGDSIEADKGDNVRRSLTFRGTEKIFASLKEVYFITTENLAFTTSNKQYYVTDN